MEEQNEKNKNKYILQYSNLSKKVNIIKLNVDNSLNVLFYYDAIELLLDFFNKNILMK